MALKPPVAVPQGAIRLNTDSQKMEFFAQDQWWEMSTFPWSDPNSSRRGLNMGKAPECTNDVTYFTLDSKGNAVDFGDMQNGVGACAAVGGNTRGIKFGGVTSYPGTFTNTIDYFNIATTGNGQDFGDMETSRRAPGGFGNSVRAGVMGGASPSYVASTTAINFVTIATTGNTQDFGYLNKVSSWNGSSQIGNSTRALAGGIGSNSPTNTNRIDYFNIATTGSVADFGELTVVMANNMVASNSIRGIFAGGENNSSSAKMDYVTIATQGDSLDFGDLTAGAHECSGMASPIEAFFMSNASADVCFVTIATAGNAADFGDLLVAAHHKSSLTNCHGGV